MKVQIISSTVGGGHQSVARALADALGELETESLQVWVDDLYADLARFPASRFPALYALLTRRYPRLWELFFRLTNRPPRSSRLDVLGDQLGGPRLGKLLRRRRPDVVVSVLPGVNGFIGRSLKHDSIQARQEVVVTDWADIHLSWLWDGVSHYTVPTESAAATCRAFGVPASALSRLGIPVRREFAQARPGPESRRAGRQRFGFGEEGFVVLAMIGTEGSAGALSHLRALAQTPLNGDLVVVCGRNEPLRREAARLGGANRVHAMGFVHEIAELMLAADVLVTKPGGVTLAEGFCCQLPVVAFDPLPGQEEANLAYVVSRGAAAYARSPVELSQLAAELRWSPHHRAALAARGAALARPTAATDAAGQVVERAFAHAQRRRGGGT